MAAPTRLVTFVEVDDRSDDDTISVSARHGIELADGDRVLLLTDRGWTESGPANIWAHTSVEDIASTARMVVGPDEPVAGRPQGDEETAHWAALQEIAERQGVIADAAGLRQLAHIVVLGPRLRARIGPDARRADGG